MGIIHLTLSERVVGHPPLHSGPGTPFPFTPGLRVRLQDEKPLLALRDHPRTQTLVSSRNSSSCDWDRSVMFTRLVS